MRVIGWILAALVAVVAILAGAVFFLPADRIARIAADQIEARTGREVRLSGETEITWWPVLGVTTGALQVANADWSRNGPMFRAEGLMIGVDAAALFGGDIHVTEVRAERPEILLERDADGRANWEFGAGGAREAAEGPAASAIEDARLQLDKARVTGAALHIIDAEVGIRRSFTDVDLSIDWPERGGAVDFAMTMRPAGDAVRVTGQVAELAALIKGATSQLELRIATPGGAAEFSGRGGAAPEIEGQLSAELNDTPAFVRALGLGPYDVPRGLGRRTAAAAMQVSLTPEQKLSLTEATLTLDNNSVSFAADVDFSAKPVVSARVGAGAIDLTGLREAGGSGGGASSGWSTAPIDLSALGLADGEITADVESFDFGDFAIGPVRTVTRIDNARAVTRVRQLSAFDGTLDGQVVINTRSGTSVGGELTVQDVSLQRMLTELAGVDRLTGSGEGQVEFLASGGSVAALMNSLSGQGRLSTGRGTIQGIDLDRLFRTGEGTGGTTIFDSIEATFEMTNGNLRNDDLVMQLASIRATGEGRIGLGAQEIDYLFTPVSLTARNGRGIAIPIRIRGPWSNPRILPDLEEAIRLNADDEVEALEDEARRRIEERLGVEGQEGESAEDAAKRGVEKKVLEGLKNLLGGGR